MFDATITDKLKPIPSPKNLSKWVAPKAPSLPVMVIGKKLVAVPISNSYLQGIKVTKK